MVLRKKQGRNYSPAQVIWNPISYSTYFKSSWYLKKLSYSILLIKLLIFEPFFRFWLQFVKDDKNETVVAYADGRDARRNDQHCVSNTTLFIIATKKTEFVILTFINAITEEKSVKFTGIWRKKGYTTFFLLYLVGQIRLKVRALIKT